MTTTSNTNSTPTRDEYEQAKVEYDALAKEFDAAHAAGDLKLRSEIADRMFLPEGIIEAYEIDTWLADHR